MAMLVLEDGGYRIACQAVPDGVSGEAVPLQPQGSRFCPEPEIGSPVLRQRINGEVIDTRKGKTLGRHVTSEPLPPIAVAWNQFGQAVVGTHPHLAVQRLEQRSDLVVRQAVSRRVHALD